ncbi:MAG: hypothetical protein AAB851_01915, partial [Patescibacteria group bacterium]
MEKKKPDGRKFILIFLCALIALFLLMILIAVREASSKKIGKPADKTGRQKSCSFLLSSCDVRQGGILSVDVFLLFGDIKHLSGTFNGKEIKFYQNGTEARALVGIDLYQKPGEYELKIIYQKEIYVEKITVKEVEFPVSYGWGRGKPYTKEDAARIIKEKRELKKALEKSRAKNWPKMWKTFEPPIEISDGFALKDYMTTPFGQIRILEEGKYGKQK